MSDPEVNLTERLEKNGQTVQEDKDAVVAHLKDKKVDVKDRDFSVRKTEKENAVEISVKLGIKPKAKL